MQKEERKIRIVYVSQERADTRKEGMCVFGCYFIFVQGNDCIIFAF